jgi:hypothetical protein
MMKTNKMYTLASKGVLYIRLHFEAYGNSHLQCITHVGNPVFPTEDSEMDKEGRKRKDKNPVLIVHMMRGQSFILCVNDSSYPK